MASQIDICNTALSRIGNRARIASLVEASEEARLCSLFYGQVLERTLSAHPWSFASRRTTLTLIEEDPNTEWQYRYELPADCVIPRYIQGAARNLPMESLVRWQVEGSTDPAKRYLLTDEPDAILVYTRRDVPPGAYPSYFTQVLECNLAAELALPLSGDAKIGELALRAAIIARGESAALDSNTRQPDEPLQSEFVRVRE